MGFAADVLIKSCKRRENNGNEPNFPQIDAAEMFDRAIGNDRQRDECRTPSVQPPDDASRVGQPHSRPISSPIPKASATRDNSSSRLMYPYPFDSSERI